MSSDYTPYQKRKIKEMVDEIIVNRGILKLKERQLQVDGKSIEQLSNLAFKYYKMILLGESPLDISKSHNGKLNSDELIKQKNQRSCIGCNEKLDKDDIIKKMPVCKSCRHKIKVDYDILKELLA